MVDDKENFFKLRDENMIIWERTIILYVLLVSAIMWICLIIAGHMLDVKDKYTCHLFMLSDDDFVRIHENLKEYAKSKYIIQK